MARDSKRGHDIKPDDVAALLKAWRGRDDLTQAAAADLLGVPLRTYQGWEAGRVGNTLQRLIVLALKAFD